MSAIRKMIMLPNRAKNPAKRKPLPQLVIDAEAIRFLEMVSLCQEMQILPKPGGLLDQDSYFVMLLQHTLKWQQDRRELDRQKELAKQPRMPR